VIDLDQHLDGIVAGDPDAFARWVAGAEPRLRDSLRPLAARVDAEAVLQEALLRVWQVAPRFVRDGRPDGLLRLGIRIARNLALDELRRARLELSDEKTIEAALAAAAERTLSDGGPPDPLLRRAIAECRALLRGQPRLALEARLESAGADSDEALAERLSMRLNTFLQNLSRARKAIAECLRGRGVEAR
jgi:RNA polymerase sigma-70 factor (ECF subfamily)